MPKIKPFRGWRYDPDKVWMLRDVLAPPYDVISAKQQDEFHRKSPYNVIRLILGKEEARDSASCNKYTRARDFLKDWISKGVLMQERQPSMYVYVQEYKEKGKLQTRIGLMAAMKIDETAVLKHENTLAKPKKDRFALIKEVQANLSPIFGLFEDKKAIIQRVLKASLKSTPALDVLIDGVRHRLYVEEREKNLKRLSDALADKPMFIADGHHRFEVACQFKNFMNSKNPGSPEAGWNYVLTYLSDCINNPFKIFPTHRLIRVPGSLKNPVKLLARHGVLKKVKDLQTVLSKLEKTREVSGETGYSFGVYTKKDGFFILELKHRLDPMAQKSPVDRLDVAVIHQRLIEPCFKIKALEKSKAIDFTRDPQEAKAEVDQGHFDLAFFLRPTSLNEMILASKKGLKMPQKSTYFYPKLLSGLVFHRFADPQDRL